LHRLLVELCGEEHRASFWRQLYMAAVLLTVGLAAILFPPPYYVQVTADSILYYLLPMLRAGLVGMLVCLGILAVTMVRFITAHDRRLP
jgi:hypothetical protein